MNKGKQYLFPSGASHLFGCIWAMGMLVIMCYDLLFGSKACLREGNVFANALMLFMILAYISLIEACMMIVSNGYLFAYNVDKALCIRIKEDDVKTAVQIGRGLFGPIFDKDCENHFSENPKSPVTRNVFYMIIVFMFLVAIIPSGFNLYKSLHSKSWSVNQTLAWLFVCIDLFLIINRIFYRASIRKFFAYTLGGKNFQEVLHSETSENSSAIQIPSCMVSSKKETDKVLAAKEKFPWIRMFILV